MIKSITLTNYQNESLKIELSNPEKSGLAVASMDGIGPVKANISTSDIASADGALYNSARLEKRSVNISFVLLPNEKNKSINTVEKIRHLLYKYLPIKKKCRITIETDTRSAYVEGFVESNEPNIFSKAETMSCSILCPDPWFYSAISENTKFSGVDPLFSFPFYSTEEKLISLGNIFTDTINNVYYSGDTETGVVITIHAVGPARNLRIYNIDSHESMTFNDERIKTITGDYIKQGDDIIISTVRGNKSCKLQRAGSEYNILNSLNRDADWFTVRKGDNQFAFTADDSEVSNPLNLIFNIESTIKYEGV